MTTPLESLVQSGTKLWLDSVDPDAIERNLGYGATGATSNPIIISDLIETGDYDDEMIKLMESGVSDDADLAWQMTDKLVQRAMDRFHDIWEKTQCNDGWVSFELDPLLEDVEQGPPHAERVAKYIELAKYWGEGRDNRMIKVPATAAGLDALEEIAALGRTLNVTLIFSERQYHAAREAVWRGRQRFGDLDKFKSVYSIFVSRVDVYTEKQVSELSPEAQGKVGLVNVKRLWEQNQSFWADKGLKLQQEIIFASTGAKLSWQPADYYVEALAGSDIQTNPPATNDAVQELGKTYTRQVDVMPPQAVLDDIDAKVDQQKLEEVLMQEGTAKFADPFKKLLGTIAQKRKQLATA